MANSRILLSPKEIGDTSYTRLRGEDARAALRELQLTYIEIDKEDRVCALCKEHMPLHGYYVYKRSSI